jgi:secondary thiamine-phosphate synthase enzyme
MKNNTISRVIQNSIADHLEIITIELDVHTSKSPEFIDISEILQSSVEKSGLIAGTALIFGRHTTAGVFINEWEPLLIKDMEVFLEEQAPRYKSYQHNDFLIRTVNLEEGEEPNGHAHCQALFLGNNQSIPIVNGQLALGKYQRVFFVELDKPRERKVLLHLTGVSNK